jgi:hypothetical protein
MNMSRNVELTICYCLQQEGKDQKCFQTSLRFCCCLMHTRQQTHASARANAPRRRRRRRRLAENRKSRQTEIVAGKIQNTNYELFYCLTHILHVNIGFPLTVW